MLNIEQIQKIESSILQEYMAFCESENLHYFVAYGSLLGTIRHKGFIPWDDDIDVMMPREDYEQLLKKGELIGGGRYKILSMSNCEEWPYLFAKCIDTFTEMEETTYKSGKIGIYIDIFPIDGVPDNPFLRKTHMMFLNFLHYLLITVQKKNLKGQTGIRTLVKRLLYPLAKAIGTKNLLRIMNCIIKKNKFDQSEFVASQTINTYGMRECFEKDIFNDYEMMEFDGNLVRVPVGFEKYLTQIYGDFMKLPPEDKRVSHHSYSVKLLKGFNSALIGDINKNR